MKTVTYDSLQAEHAWMIVSDQLQQRNNMLAKSISHMERNPGELPMASRLIILRYHLKMSLRLLTQEARQQKQQPKTENQLATQWMHVHQLFFLLRQIDNELGRATNESHMLRSWMGKTEGRVYRSALVHLN
ncbi:MULTISPECIES: hypothetical protein [Spirosoma]|uniref:Uncharacterized protein n=1 Tax=Spirosoma linguale (strain ATCC 33905 / DSM 74 / LMG 10896 / Claus 1) TaxID=504472 RepID=D2QEE1_SPILD|nr:hypothetical protein [Spirosoma sp.]ADB36496.1 hypothetical protein Slin_0432 [Spirosoma linguale DSM 74]MCX6218027.1 hypothetical protein [Spirosoma sp.]